MGMDNRDGCPCLFYTSQGYETMVLVFLNSATL